MMFPPSSSARCRQIRKKDFRFLFEKKLETTKSFHMFQEPFIFHRHLSVSAARSVYCLWTLSTGSLWRSF